MRYKTNEQAKQALLKHIDSKEKGFCSVIALAQVTDCSISRAYHEMSAVGRKARKGATTKSILEAVLKMGYSVDALAVEGMTVNQFTKICTSTSKYLVFVRGHVLAVRGGKVRDWSAGKANRRRILACALIK